ncbi:OLC1v1039164C1 [Oldenlandia corymbosa var. corymbosa]|uniref:OLC1v1039164C1 n=1 Tax=Oldenlandia corymbosa var. corymbosa TaxID=529605 RepID=A0AAV1D545_OLDCO|nr:OLC1v1039164C1 [Oldenlandia corymbosa var. corymbosa]
MDDIDLCCFDDDDCESCECCLCCMSLPVKVWCILFILLCLVAIAVGIWALITQEDYLGIEELEELKDSSELWGDLIFHRLDVVDSPSVALLAEFVKAQFGRLDILDTVKRSWGKQIKGTKMIQVTCRLKQLKAQLKELNRIQFDDIVETANRDQRLLQGLQEELANDPCMELPPGKLNPIRMHIPEPSLQGQGRFAIVTGSNKGLGFEIVRQLASLGITVVLTARDEKRGLDALHELKESGGLSGDVIFHQLDVADSSSVASLAEFVTTEFGRLDILVNNAAILGVYSDGADSLTAAVRAGDEGVEGSKDCGNELVTQTYDLALNCLQTNYYGAKRMIESFLPLLQSSQSPRIVNVSAEMGKLENIPSKWAQEILSDVDNLTEERVDEVVNEFLKDFKEGTLETKGWPLYFGAYRVSKAAMNAYTRIVAKKQLPNMKANCVCPGYVKTDMNFNSGILTVEEGADKIMKLVVLPDDGPSGLFFARGEVTSF